MSSKKKICFVVSSPFTAKVFLLNHFKKLSNHYEIYLIANFERHNIEFENVFELKNIPIQRGISIKNDLLALFELVKFFKEKKFDSVHSITPKAGLLTMLASKIANVNLRIHIFTGQVWSTKKGLFRYFLRMLDKLIVFCATDILVDGASQRDFLITNNILSLNNSKVLGKGSISGADENVFIPNKKQYYDRRRLLNIDNEIVFLFLARVIKEKGIIDLSNAFVQLNQKFPNTKLLIIGPDEGNLIQLVNQITQKKNVIVKGATNMLLEDLQVCDVLCHPSYREGFGTVLIQASLLEKPIICSNTYGLQETIIENVTGLRHKVGDVDSLLIQMERMMNEDLRTRLGKNGREYVLNNFTADLITNEWVNFYRKRLRT
jgi:glycosyltransferase involved in cell wall biosynthesis